MNAADIARELELDDAFIARLNRPRVRAALYQIFYAEAKRLIAEQNRKTADPNAMMRLMNGAGGV